MPDFRVYFKGLDGHFVKMLPLVGMTEADAIVQARQWADACDVEVWEGGRLVVSLGKRDQASS